MREFWVLDVSGVEGEREREKKRKRGKEGRHQQLDMDGWLNGKQYTPAQPNAPPPQPQ